MSDQIDDQAFEEYLQRKSPLSRHYGELADVQVPAAMDRAVLDAASRAVEKKAPARSRAWLRWAPPLALAASMVLTLAIVIESGVQEQSATVPLPKRQAVEVPLTAPANMDKQVDSTAELADSSPGSASIDQMEEKKAKEEKRAQKSGSAQPAEETPGPFVPQLTRTSSTRPQAPPPPPMPQVAQEPAAAQQGSLADEQGEAAASAQRRMETVSVTGQRPGSNVQSAPVAISAVSADRAARSGPRDTIRPAETSAQVQARQEASQRYEEPALWLDYIRQLRKAGRHDEADGEWREFVRAHPDYSVAKDDIARSR